MNRTDLNTLLLVLVLIGVILIICGVGVTAAPQVW